MGLREHVDYVCADLHVHAAHMGQHSQFNTPITCYRQPLCAQITHLCSIRLSGHDPVVAMEEHESAHLTTGRASGSGALAALLGLWRGAGLERHGTAALCHCSRAKATSGVPI